MTKAATMRLYRLYTYNDVWEETKKKHNLSNEQLKKKIENQLQMWAWSDIITEGIEKVSIVIPDKEIEVYKFPHTIIIASDEKPKVKDGRDRISSASESSP